MSAPASAGGVAVREQASRGDCRSRPEGSMHSRRDPGSWQLLRLDPVLGTTRADLDALRRYMANSVETTLASLAQWIAEQRQPLETTSGHSS
jgi:hypothetical protein